MAEDPPIIRVKATGASTTSRIVVKGTGQRDDIRIVATGGDREGIRRFVASGTSDAAAIPASSGSDLAKKLYGIDHKQIESVIRSMSGVGAIEAAYRQYDEVERVKSSFDVGVDMVKLQIQAADANQRAAASMMGLDAAKAAMDTISAYERASRESLVAQTFAANQIARLEAIQSLPAQILAQFSPLSADLLAQLRADVERVESPLVRRLRAEEQAWQWFVRDLEMNYGIDGKRLVSLLRDPLEALSSVARLEHAEERVAALERLQTVGPTRDDHDGQEARRVEKWLKDARRERAAAHRAVKAARLLPGTKGRRLLPPKGDDTWAATVRRDRRWLNPTAWPWLNDRAFDVARYLSNHVSAQRSTGLLGRKGLRGRPMTKKVSELTADIMNRWYRRHLLYKLDITPTQVKAAVSHRMKLRRKSVKSWKSR